MGGKGSGPGKGKTGGVRPGSGRKALPAKEREKRLAQRRAAVDAVTVSVVFTPELLSRLTARAKREGKSRSALIREILETAVN